MRTILAAGLLALPAVAQAGPMRAGDMPVIDPNPPTIRKCPPISRYHAMKKGGAPMARKLAELPPADTYRAVFRRIDGCQVPVIVRYGVTKNP